VRIEKTQMEQLGIQKGDIVKIIGRKTAHAFCFPCDDDNINQNDRNFVCLDESSKNIPVIRISGLTHSNLGNFDFGNLVELQKSSATKASKVIVKPLYVLGTTEKKGFNLDWMEEQVVVSKGDHMAGSHHDPKKVPRFVVIGATPDSEAWIIDKTTQFEISDKLPEDLHGMIRTGGNLNSVIPVVQQIKGDDFEVTISAIEVYDNCMKIIMYVKDNIVHQEDWTSGLCTPAIKMWDDLGNHYQFNRYGARGGGTQFGDALWGGPHKHENFSEISLITTPTLDKRAKELNMSIEQLLWNVRKHPPRSLVPVKKALPPVMAPVSRIDEKYVIHGGPWKLRIPIKEK